MLYGLSGNGLPFLDLNRCIWVEKRPPCLKRPNSASTARGLAPRPARSLFSRLSSLEAECWEGTVSAAQRLCLASNATPTEPIAFAGEAFQREGEDARVARPPGYCPAARPLDQPPSAQQNQIAPHGRFADDEPLAEIGDGRAVMLIDEGDDLLPPLCIERAVR